MHLNKEPEGKYREVTHIIREFIPYIRAYTYILLLSRVYYIRPVKEE